MNEHLNVTNGFYSGAAKTGNKLCPAFQYPVRVKIVFCMKSSMVSFYLFYNLSKALFCNYYEVDPIFTIC